MKNSRFDLVYWVVAFIILTVITFGTYYWTVGLYGNEKLGLGQALVANGLMLGVCLFLWLLTEPFSTKKPSAPSMGKETND